MEDPAGVIAQEIAGGAKREEIARTYALALKLNGLDWDYRNANLAIIERWSMSALVFIKARAWQYVNGERAFCEPEGGAS